MAGCAAADSAESCRWKQIDDPGEIMAVNLNVGRNAANAIPQPVLILTGNVALEADVVVPEPARGVALFAHGSGSSRHSPRNRYVAAARPSSVAAVVSRSP